MNISISKKYYYGKGRWHPNYRLLTCRINYQDVMLLTCVLCFIAKTFLYVIQNLSYKYNTHVTKVWKYYDLNRLQYTFFTINNNQFRFYVINNETHAM